MYQWTETLLVILRIKVEVSGKLEQKNMSGIFEQKQKLGCMMQGLACGHTQACVPECTIHVSSYAKDEEKWDSTHSYCNDPNLIYVN